MHLVSLDVTDFRNIARCTIEPDPQGTTVITGLNGAGKTSLLEAIGYLATLQSFRGSPREEMIRNGAHQAILRAEARSGERTVTLEAELSTTARHRMQVNRQPVRRRIELHDVLRTTVFSPEDIGVVRAGPSHRRRFLDEALRVVDPRSARSADEVERILRQRSALLKGSARRMSPEVAATLDVWDTRLHDSGTALVEAREELVAALGPIVESHYSRLAGTDTQVRIAYTRSWDGSLADALAAARGTDLAKGMSTLGPHRDDLELFIDDLPARTQASQGEQRSLALALQLSAHLLATEQLGSAPVLLLDDVFSELDAERSRSLLAGLPPGQTLLTTAVPPPLEVQTAKSYRFATGRLTEGSTG